MKDRIEELAHKCGLLGYQFIKGKPVREKISSREIQFFNEALELAARECQDGTTVGNHFAAAIRKLKVSE